MRRALLVLLPALLPLHAGAATVLVYGDSLSAGYGLARGEDWAQLLAQRLQQFAQRVTGPSSGPTGRASSRSGLPADPPNMQQQRAEPNQAAAVQSEPTKIPPNKARAVASENQCPHSVSLDIEFVAGYKADGTPKFEVQRLNLRSGMKTSFSTIFTHEERVKIRVQRRQPGESPPAEISAAWEPFKLERAGDQLLFRLRGPWCD